MNIIVIDAAFACVSVLASGKLGTFSSSFYPATLQRGKDIQRFIEITTKEAGFLVSETEVIAVPEGPGGFTGLRLGYSVAKAISLACGAAVLAVPTLTLLDFSQRLYDRTVLAVIDAKRDSFYAQVFEKHQPVTRVFDESVRNILTLLDCRFPSLVVGIGAYSFKEQTNKLLLRHLYTFVEVPQHAMQHYLLDYVLENRSLCKEVKDEEGPMYVRKSDAEMNEEKNL